MPTFRRVCLAAFVVYTLVLLTATHWPGLSVQGPVSRTDLIIHVGAFLTWTALLGFSGLVGRAVWRLAVAGAAFAVFDETTQPLFDRQFDWLDLAADFAGVGLACLTLWSLWRRPAAERGG
jgi:hypothetical protein